MKVKELIAEISKLNPEANITTWPGDPYGGEFNENSIKQTADKQTVMFFIDGVVWATSE